MFPMVPSPQSRMRSVFSGAEAQMVPFRAGPTSVQITYHSQRQKTSKIRDGQDESQGVSETVTDHRELSQRTVTGGDTSKRKTL